MSAISFSEFLLLCVIGLIVLGPERLPRVARQLGGWIGQARRMTRMMKRQLDEELNLDEDLKSIQDVKHDLERLTNVIETPRDDDTYSPIHDNETPAVASEVVKEVTRSDDAVEPVAESGEADESEAIAETDEEPREQRKA